MNGFYVLVLAATIVGAVYWIPRALAHDRWMFEMDNLDDDELAAVLAEFPDALTRRLR
jgi:hypothetical protein